MEPVASINVASPEFARDVVAFWYKNRKVPNSMGVTWWCNNRDDSHLYFSAPNVRDEDSESKREQIREWCRTFWKEMRSAKDKASEFINPEYNYIFFKTKFPSKCAETGNWIRRGDVAVFVPEIKKVYCKDSNVFKHA